MSLSVAYRNRVILPSDFSHPKVTWFTLAALEFSLSWLASFGCSSSRRQNLVTTLEIQLVWRPLHLTDCWSQFAKAFGVAYLFLIRSRRLIIVLVLHRCNCRAFTQ